MGGSIIAFAQVQLAENLQQGRTIIVDPENFSATVVVNCIYVFMVQHIVSEMQHERLKMVLKAQFPMQVKLRVMIRNTKSFFGNTSMCCLWEKRKN